jgi:hypothetical protein
MSEGALGVRRQAAAVGVFLRFFRFGILAFEVGEIFSSRFALLSAASEYVQ